MAAWVFVITVVGTDLIFHRFFLADDEFSAWFQAAIFEQGRWNAVVSPEWCRWIQNLAPTSIVIPQPCTWHVGFLPIHSLIRAGFLALGGDRFAGPVLATVSVLLVGSIARRLWPERPHRAWIAMAVLAVSTQFLIMSMTMYAMPTHLFFALVWLWLYVVDRRWSIIALPLVGFLAMGVHSPTPHLLFVPPFLFRYVRQRRLVTAAYVIVCYAIGIVFWRTQYVSGGATIAPIDVAAISATGAAVGGFLKMPSIFDLYTSAMHLTLVATWNSPIAVICVVAACLSWSRLDAFSRDAATSLVFTVVIRALSTPIQGEGWGYRYVYANLGNFALLAACGSEILAAAIGTRRAAMLLGTSLATSLVIELPVRGIQVESIIGPYYRAYEYMSHLPAKIVVFSSGDYMWSRQLVRNDPFLRRTPLILDVQLHQDALPAACFPGRAGDASGTAKTLALNKLCFMIQSSLANWTGDELVKLYPGQVHVMRAEEVTRLGLAGTRFHILPILVDQKTLSGMQIR
jgi:hypothetical protein